MKYPGSRIPRVERARSKAQTNVPLAAALRCPPLKIHRRLQQRRRCLRPFVATERASPPQLSFLPGDTPFVSIDPSSIFETEATEAAARPGVMRFYEGESGLRAAPDRSPPICFSLRPTRGASTGNNATSIGGKGRKRGRAPRGGSKRISAAVASRGGQRDVR